METETLQEKKTHLIPKLRFKEFEGEWQTYKLKNIATVNPKTRSLPNQFTYIDLESVTKGILLKEEQILSENAPSRAQRVLDPNDILYQTVRPYQKNNFFFNKQGDYVASTGYAQLKSKGDAKFLYQFLHTSPFVNIVNRWSTGTSYPAISPSELEKIRLKFPALPEQQKIASFLSAVDKKVQQLIRRKELVETYKKGVMQQLFSQKIRFKDEDGKDFPVWEKKHFGDVYMFLSTNSFSRSDLNYDKGVVKNIHYGDIHTKFPNLFHLSKEKVPFINDEKDISRIPSENYCQEGDLVIADASEDYIDIGKTIEIIELNDQKVLAGLHTFLARPIPKTIHKGFSGYLVQDWKFRKQAMTIAQGTKVLGLATGRMKKLKLEIPSISEQQKIAEFLSAIDKKIEAVSQQIEKTQSFKKGLLQQMFV